MVSLKKTVVIDLLTDDNAASISCDKYDSNLYSVIGVQLAGIPEAGTNYLFRTDGGSSETVSDELPNYYANPDASWFPDPIPSGYIGWGFLNLQGVQLIESNDDGTFKLICPDCYAQAIPEEGSGNPPLDVSFPADIYMDSDLNVDYDLSTFYTDGTFLDTSKKTEDFIGDVKYEIVYNPDDKQIAYLQSSDTQVRAVATIGVYETGGDYDFNCIDPNTFVVTYNTDILASDGVYVYGISIYQESFVEEGVVTQPQEKFPDRRYYEPSSNKGKISTITFGKTLKKSIKRPRDIKGKSRWIPYK